MFEIVIFIIILVFSVILHELGHGYSAHLQNDPTPHDAGRLTLNPIPHIDPMGTLIVPGVLVAFGASFLFGWAKPMPYNPYNLKWGIRGEALVAASGALVNIAIALLASFAFFLFSPTSVFVIAVLKTAIVVNILLAVINLLPIPPLDGYRVLVSLLPASQRLSVLRLEAAFSERGGFFVLFALTFFFLYIFITPISQFVSFIASLLIPGV